MFTHFLKIQQAFYVACKLLESSSLNFTGGGAGIRTLGGVTPTTVFETVPFDRSGTPPHLVQAGIDTRICFRRQGA